MDQNTLVEGGDEGLRRVAQAFRAKGFPVEATYLVRRRSLSHDDDEWVLVLVIPSHQPGTSREFIYSLVDLQRGGELPFIDPSVRLEAVDSEHVEAARLLKYLRRFDRPPPIVRDLGLGGLLIDYALIGEDRGRPAKAA